MVTLKGLYLILAKRLCGFRPNRKGRVQLNWEHGELVPPRQGLPQVSILFLLFFQR